MNRHEESRSEGRGRAVLGLSLPIHLIVGFALAILSVALIGVLSYRALQERTATAQQVSRTFEVLGDLDAIVGSVTDAETSQRGFLLTGDERYLAPYLAAETALPGQLEHLRPLLADNPTQQQNLAALSGQITGKMAELRQTIELRRGGDAAAAMTIVRSDRGKAAMDRIRALAAAMIDEERSLLAVRQENWRAASELSSYVTWGGTVVLFLLILAAAALTARDHRRREIEAWLRSGQLGLSGQLEGEQRLEVLGERVLQFLAPYLGARVGAVHIREGAETFRRVAGYAMAANAVTTRAHGDGLLLQAAKENRPLHIADVPPGYLDVTSAVGRSRPGALLIAPASVDRAVHAVIELGFFRPLDSVDLDFMTRASESLGVAVRSSRDRSRLEDLLEETQRQAEELQAQQEELRVINEELEERGRILSESQSRLEAQRAELEESNAQLEEQTQQLEQQTDELTRIQDALADKAMELERSNQYKSEFLANMSHELRTPLNSSLILAKLLADNPHGNLSEEQVRYAETISSAGNDLLALINDILDLSKIEAGRMEVDPQTVVVESVLQNLTQTIAPMAADKALAFRRVIDGAPAQFETDPQRLGQILTNLLSNAIKFTDVGEVVVRVFAPSPDRIAFAVVDTGVGIPSHQLGIIFEAFRQADGSTHRKYQGTGLGLSISRDLARLLGGDISVESTVGKGSVFTLTLPRQYGRGAQPTSPPPARIEPARPAPAPLLRRPDATAGRVPAQTVSDDRDQLQPNDRLLLVIEDDARFAGILRDQAHELGFQCVVAGSAHDGLLAAATYRPQAIVLDINLPDHSGLGVLDHLKRHPETRHIPVHVVSVADYAREAYEMGAIGYAFKPINKEQLVGALRKLEAKLAQGLRRVLVIEDDDRQRESIVQLLGSADVHITGVATADAALAQLESETFDCAVMDLNLPGVSGYDLLERMSERDRVSFPPVIVYTGRTLTSDEEHRLRRYARSIIIKDARSPERLLDEVTLFLHQVEANLPVERQRMLKAARDRDASLEGRRVLVVEDDVRNIFALTSVLEPRGVQIEIARNGREALTLLERAQRGEVARIDLVLMDIMMPEMDGLTAMREIRKRAEWRKLPIIALTAKAMRDDQDECLRAGANDYIAKPLDVDQLLSLVRVWMPK